MASRKDYEVLARALANTTIGKKCKSIIVREIGEAMEGANPRFDWEAWNLACYAESDRKPKMARVYCWIRTPSDPQHTAGATASALIPQKDVLEVARNIEYHGDAGKYGKDFALKEGCRFQSGHGVLIRYESGRTREIKEGV